MEKILVKIKTTNEIIEKEIDNIFIEKILNKGKELNIFDGNIYILPTKEELDVYYTNIESINIQKIKKQLFDNIEANYKIKKDNWILQISTPTKKEFKIEYSVSKILEILLSFKINNIFPQTIESIYLVFKINSFNDCNTYINNINNTVNSYWEQYYRNKMTLIRNAKTIDQLKTIDISFAKDLIISI